MQEKRLTIFRPIGGNMRYLFIGNRFSVLEQMLEKNLDVFRILTPPDSYLARELEQKNIPYSVVENKKQACSAIEATSFDVLVSNGCPFILPVSSIQKEGQRFINIHPSPLPDLKGINPINAALLFQRPGGASCHIMDDTVDGGPLIARISIPMTADMDIGLLYQLSFLAERDVFLTSLARNFIPDATLSLQLPYPPIYYSRKEEDLEINFEESAVAIVRRIRAFALPSQGAYFKHKNKVFKVMNAAIIENPYLQSMLKRYRDHEVAFCYGNSIVLRKGDGFLRFSGIIGDMQAIAVGDLLAPATE